jgi:hypothetical protein
MMNINNLRPREIAKRDAVRRRLEEVQEMRDDDSDEITCFLWTARSRIQVQYSAGEIRWVPIAMLQRILGMTVLNEQLEAMRRLGPRSKIRQFDDGEVALAATKHATSWISHGILASERNTDAILSQDNHATPKEPAVDDKEVSVRRTRHQKNGSNTIRSKKRDWASHKRLATVREYTHAPRASLTPIRLQCHGTPNVGIVTYEINQSKVEDDEATVCGDAEDDDPNADEENISSILSVPQHGGKSTSGKIRPGAEDAQNVTSAADTHESQDDAAHQQENTNDEQHEAIHGERESIPYNPEEDSVHHQEDTSDKQQEGARPLRRAATAPTPIRETHPKHYNLRARAREQTWNDTTRGEDSFSDASAESKHEVDSFLRREKDKIRVRWKAGDITWQDTAGLEEDLGEQCYHELLENMEQQPQDNSASNSPVAGPARRPQRPQRWECPLRVTAACTLDHITRKKLLEHLAVHTTAQRQQITEAYLGSRGLTRCHHCSVILKEGNTFRAHRCVENDLGGARAPEVHPAARDLLELINAWEKNDDTGAEESKAWKAFQHTLLGATPTSGPGRSPGPDPSNDQDEESSSPMRTARQQTDEDLNKRITRCKALIRAGEDGKALQTLSQEAKAPSNSETWKELKRLHPEASVEELREVERIRPDDQGSRKQPFQATVDAVNRALKSSKITSSPSSSGVSYAHLKAIGATPDGREAITKVTNFVLQGKTPRNSTLRSAKLIALSKGADKVRPIAIDETLFRLISRTVAKEMKDDFRDLLAPHQFGVGTQGGQEAITYLINENTRKGTPCTLAIDMTNAFNTVSRAHLLKQVAIHVPELFPYAKWAYGSPNLLQWEGEELYASRGIKQGDPLSSFWFSLAIREPLRITADAFPNVQITAYLDDIQMQGGDSDTRQAYEMLQEEMEKIGLHINRDKTQLLVGEGVDIQDFQWETILPPANIVRPSQGQGMVILGVPHGHKDYQRTYLSQRLITENKKMRGLKEAHDRGMDSQVVMRLLTNTIAKQPNFWLRTLPCDVTREMLFEFNVEMLNFLKVVLKWDEEGEGQLPEHAIRRAQLPTKMGGLSILSPDLAAEAAFMAGAIGASKTIVKVAGDTEDPLREFKKRPPPWLQQAYEALRQAIGPPEAEYEGFWQLPKPQYSIQKLLHKVALSQLKSEIDTTQQAVLTASSATEAAAWLYCAPWKRYLLDDTEYMKALRLRLGLRQTGRFNGPSGMCCKDGPVDELMHHGLSCGETGKASLRIRRHDQIAAELRKFIQLAQLDVQREVGMPPKNPGLDDLRMDLVARDPIATIYLDICVTNPLTERNKLRTAAKPLAAAAEWENLKRGKYHHLRKPNTELVPFVLETTGGFGVDAVKFLKRIARRIPASRWGIREARNFRKLMTAKLSIVLMRGNIKLLDTFREDFSPQEAE